MTTNSLLHLTRREKVLALYRRINKLSLTWKNIEEREYIRTESQTLFRENMYLEDPDVIDNKIFEAESRLELAIHYNIPYPRPYNVPPKQAQRDPNFRRIVPAYLHSRVPEDTKEIVKDDNRDEY